MRILTREACDQAACFTACSGTRPELSRPAAVSHGRRKAKTVAEEHCLNSGLRSSRREPQRSMPGMERAAALNESREKFAAIIRAAPEDKGRNMAASSFRICKEGTQGAGAAGSPKYEAAIPESGAGIRESRNFSVCADPCDPVQHGRVPGQGEHGGSVPVRQKGDGEKAQEPHAASQLRRIADGVRPGRGLGERESACEALSQGPEGNPPPAFRQDPAAGEGVKQAAFGKNEAAHAACPWRADKSPHRDKTVLEGVVGEEPVFPEAGDEEAGTIAPRPA